MKRNILLICIDSLAFFFALVSTYVVFSTFQFNFISLLLFKAYSHVILFLWLLFLVTVNCGGLYYSKKPIYAPIRILLVSFLYFVELFFIAYFYPKYALSRALLLNHFLFLYLYLNGFRLLIFKFSQKLL